MIFPNKKGFVLIEMIIYIALFSIMIGGLVVTAFQLMQSGNKTGSRIVVQEEMNFVLRKIDWTLTGASDISVSGDQKKLTITNSNLPVSPITIEFDSINNKIKLDNQDITTVNIHIDSLIFTYLPPVGSSFKGVKIDIVINGQTATLTNYLKK